MKRLPVNLSFAAPNGNLRRRFTEVFPEEEPMIDLHYFPTPNTWKVSIMLEECGLPYRVVPVNIMTGDQFKPEFLRISPNNRVPAIVDHEGDGGPLALFESGAILVYLAEKTGRLLPPRGAARADVLQWLFWQMGGLGPMAGQVHHFHMQAPDNGYAVERYGNELHRLYTVMDEQLEARLYLAGEYSIADIACWGWVHYHELQQVRLEDYPRVQAWFREVGQRPAVQRGCAVGKGLFERPAELTEEQRRLLYGPSRRRRGSGA
jgi:GSH-dependent disulfide-bond oxidoreductase